MCKHCVLIQPGPFTLSLPADSPPTASGQLIHIKLDDLDGMNEPGPLMCNIYTCKCAKKRHQVYCADHRRHRDNARADAVRQMRLGQFEAEEKCKKQFTVYLTKWVMEVGVHIVKGKRGPAFSWCDFENSKSKAQMVDHDRVGRWFDHIGWLAYFTKDRLKTMSQAEQLWNEACNDLVGYPIRDFDGDGDCDCDGILCNKGKLRINKRCKGSGDDKVVARTREEETNKLVLGTARKTNPNEQFLTGLQRQLGHNLSAFSDTSTYTGIGSQFARTSSLAGDFCSIKDYDDDKKALGDEKKSKDDKKSAITFSGDIESDRGQAMLLLSTNLGKHLATIPPVIKSLRAALADVPVDDEQAGILRQTCVIREKALQMFCGIVGGVQNQKQAEDEWPGMQEQKPWDLINELPTCSVIAAGIKTRFKHSQSNEDITEGLKRYDEMFEVLVDGVRVSNISANALTQGWKQIQRQKLVQIQKDQKSRTVEAQKAAAKDVEQMRTAHEQAQALALTAATSDVIQAGQSGAARPAASTVSVFDIDFASFGCPKISAPSQPRTFNMPFICDATLDMARYENLGLMSSAFETNFPKSAPAKNVKERQATFELYKLPQAVIKTLETDVLMMAGLTPETCSTPKVISSSLDGQNTHAAVQRLTPHII